MTDAAALLDHPGWRRLLAAARRSLERTGGRLDGAVSITAPDDDERRVVIGLTGVHRPTDVRRLTVRLTELDAHLLSAYGSGLAVVLSQQIPLRDRPSERRQEQAGRDTLLSHAAGSRHAGLPWYESWLAGLRRDGTLTRAVRGGLPFPQVVTVLDALPAADEPMPVFAQRVLADTKALTAGPVRSLVLRALALRYEVPTPAGAEQERALWELAGVVPDDLASQVLVVNLSATGGLLGSWLTSAAAAHVPLRVTLHQLRLSPLALDCDEIFVCENPALLRAYSARAGTRPLVCTEGTPSVATHVLLRAVRPGTVIRWRNDFDWPGIRLTSAAMARHPTAVPWRMSAADYASASDVGPELAGVPAATPWDPALSDTMSRTGRAVMEERLLDVLLHDLTSPVTKPAG